MSSNSFTEVRTAPGAKVLLAIDGDDIRTAAGGERLLVVDGDDIRPTPGGERLLFLDGDDVRPEPGGIRLAVWDGETLRRTTGFGKILLVVDGSDIRDEDGKRLLFLDGDTPTRAQLTAALFKWKPALFELSKKEKDAQKAEIAEGQAWEMEQAQPEAENGTYRQLSATGDFAPSAGCTIKWTGTHYTLKFEKTGLVGIGLKMENSGFHIIGGLATGAFTVGLFQYKGKAYNGGWITKPGAEPQTDSWITEIDNLEVFESKQGELFFAPTDERLNGEGEVTAVTGDKGVNGYAYKILNYLVIVLSDHQPAVFDFVGKYSTLQAGDYFGGGDIKGYLTLDR